MKACVWFWLGVVIGYFGGLLFTYLLKKKRKE